MDKDIFEALYRRYYAPALLYAQGLCRSRHLAEDLVQDTFHEAYLKFDRLLRRALELGCDCVVSGHYAQVRKSGDRYLLYKAADKTKDQTYFLACLNQQQLSHIQFPLGELTKAQVREIAAEPRAHFTARFQPRRRSSRSAGSMAGTKVRSMAQFFRTSSRLFQ